jgi:hypothetical protein
MIKIKRTRTAMAIRSRTAVLRVTGGGLLLAAAVLLAPAQAAAGCGDYVTVLNDGPAGNSTTPHGPTGDHGPAHNGPVKPCHGPGCRDAPGHLPVPIPPPTAGSPPHDALPAASACPEPPGVGRLPTGPSLSPRHVPRPIFHPPRD